MTDQSITAQIDQMATAAPFSGSSSRGTADNQIVTVDRDSLAVMSSVSTGTTSTTAATHSDSYLAVGRDLAADIEQMDTAIDRLEGSLREVVKYDAETGQPLMRYTGKDRSDFQLQLDGLKQARTQQIAANALTQQNRNAATSATLRQQQEDAVRHAYTQGRPDKAALLQQELDAAEARHTADLIVKARRGQ